MGGCLAESDPNSIWPHMCPNMGAAYLYSVLFGLTTIAHFVQGIVHKKAYSWVMVASGVLQTSAYILRTLSIHHVTNVNYYTYWFVLMMIAPIWTNAFAYMIMGRMVYNFTTLGSVFKIKAWRFGLIFVLLEVVAFFIQVTGAVMASGNNSSEKTIMLEIHIYMGGIGFQQLCIFVFLASAVRMHMHLRQQPPTRERTTALILLYVEYAVVSLITVRIIFRLIEYHNGIASTIPEHEQYQYVFDSTMMFITSVLFNMFHPGRLMLGKESNLPSRKQRKAMKKAGEVPHGRAGDYVMLGKGQERTPSPSSDIEMGR